MTRVAIDSDAAVGALEQLRISADGMQHAAGELIRPHLAMFPPHVLALVVSEQLRLAGGLTAGSVAVSGQRALLALRLASFLAADGSGADARTIEAIRSALLGPGLDAETARILWSGAEVLGGIGTASDVLELSLFGMIAFGQRGLPGYERMSLRYFHGEYSSKVLGSAGSKTLGAAGFAVALKHNYEASGAVTPFGKGVSALLGAGVPAALDARLFRGAPVFSTVDGVTGIFSGTQDATVVLAESGIRALFGDTAGANAELAAWSASALAGERGLMVQGIAIAGDRLGGALYDGAQQFEAAGEAFGGALYDAGHAAAELADDLGDAAGDFVQSIPRPSWLGG